MRALMEAHKDLAALFLEDPVCRSRLSQLSRCRPLPRSPGGSQDKLDVPAHGAIAFAGQRLEPGAINQLDPAAPGPDQARVLQGMRGKGDRGSAHPEHHRYDLLGQRQGIAVMAIAGVQQPAGEAGLDGVHGVAGGRLLQVGDHHVVGHRSQGG